MKMILRTLLISNLILLLISCKDVFGPASNQENATNDLNQIKNEEVLHLVKNVNKQASEGFLHMVLPETKGRMLYVFSDYNLSYFIDDEWSSHGNVMVKDAAIKVLLSIRNHREWQEVMEHLALRVENDGYGTDPEEETVKNKKKQQRVRDSEDYLRSGLLNDTEDWDKVLNHIAKLSDAVWDQKRK